MKVRWDGVTTEVGAEAARPTVIAGAEGMKAACLKHRHSPGHSPRKPER